VVGVDTDQSKIGRLARGQAPIFEPGLDDLLTAGLDQGRLSFQTDIAAVAGAQIHFICVGTPQRPDGPGADLRALEAAVSALAENLAAGAVVVGKSTVPVGTARRLAEPVAQGGGELVWNPEFLREGHAVSDTLRPDRIVLGLAEPATPSRAATLLDRLYRPMLEAGTPRLTMSYESAELVKTAANSYLALRVSFINAVSDLADAAGGDIQDVAAALRLDERIGSRFFNPGLGFGGGCLPKDLRSMIARADELGLSATSALLTAADQVNEARSDRAAELAAAALGGSLQGRRIALLGLSFKPLSDDIRQSQSIRLGEAMVRAGALVTATDPAALAAAKVEHRSLAYAESVAEAVAQADLVVLATEWDEYRQLDPASLAALSPARTVLDARGVLDAARWTAAGWTVHSPGRPTFFGSTV
ncbi:MAG: UDP-glucose/GDP-mannose dehydrogenase family protein, partial [Bifidobacteriaceae bacterium]|jgi:UDPglucose 6-dehydrogenase|nr:UDP-glucose/GDP-mannose dehydrogenase family protein [Bifidobacteriaceae bacterium]